VSRTGAANAARAGTMRTPAFWYRPPGIAARLLAPVGAVWDAVGRRRLAAGRPAAVGVPVVCVGNLVAGGAGKTPVALALAAALAGHGVQFLTRGYGGSEAGPLRVDPDRHDWTLVGDEALLLASHAPTWVARDRVAGARAAAADGAGIVVMDDGFQNPGLAKDLSLLVVDGAAGFGNGRLIPAGPLRERIEAGLARADAVVVLGDDRAGVAARLPAGLPRLAARLEPSPESRQLRGVRVLPFAGIGRPEKFFATCAGLGAAVVGTAAFPDHHPYRPEEIMAVVERAAALGAVPVTTAKDFVRLPADARPMVRVVSVSVAWADPGALALLLDRLPAPAHGNALP
jgi:tetraacyldisaccharide 4'-kinase